MIFLRLLGSKSFGGFFTFGRMGKDYLEKIRNLEELLESLRETNLAYEKRDRSYTLFDLSKENSSGGFK